MCIFFIIRMNITYIDWNKYFWMWCNFDITRLENTMHKKNENLWLTQSSAILSFLFNPYRLLSSAYITNIQLVRIFISVLVILLPCYICFYIKCVMCVTFSTFYFLTDFQRGGFRCSMCPMAFDSLWSLHVHQSAHTGSRPLECRLCHRSFTEPGNLKRHLLTHTGERPFECRVCLRRFNQLTHLKRHEETHSDHRFDCHVCGKSFKRSETVKKHIEMNHPEFAKDSIVDDSTKSPEKFKDETI